MAFRFTAEASRLKWRAGERGRPVTCKQHVDACLCNLVSNLTLSLNEQITPPIACSIIALIDICEPIYHVSHALRTFLADAPRATLRAQNRYPRT